MTFFQRLLIGIGILLVDIIVFVLPLTALFLVYILMLNPAWFRDFLNRLEQESKGI